MSKRSGLGAQIWIQGFDLSGDVGEVNNMTQSRNLLPATGIDKSAMERILGLRDGDLSLMAYFNDAAGHSHPVLSAIPTTDVHALYAAGTALGDKGFGIIGKQMEFNQNRGADGSLVLTTSIKGNGFALEEVEMLTAGARTDTGATTGTGVYAGAQTTAVTITSSSVANPTVITTAAPHLLATGDTIVIAGHSGSTPAINSKYVVTVTGASTFTIPVNVSGGGTGGTMTRTSSDYGLAAYLHVLSFSGTDATIKLQHSADDSTYADITGGGFTAISSAPTKQRIQTSLTAIIRGYVRATTVTSGGFTSLVFALGFKRYPIAIT